MSRPNVLVFGLGGIGGVYACILHLGAQVDVSVVARSNYDAVKELGFDFKSIKFGSHEKLRFAGVFKDCIAAAASGKKFDYVLCANKALLDHTPSLADTLEPVISAHTSIVLLQNGVGSEDPLHQHFPNTTIISAVVWTGAKALKPAGAEQSNQERLTIGVDYSSSDTAIRAAEDKDLSRIVAYLRAGKGECEVTKDIQSQRWIKVIWNCCWNSLTTVMRCRTGIIFIGSEVGEELCHRVMEEVATVARVKGLTIPEETVERLFQECHRVAQPGLPSSMMFDNQYGRPMEVEVILGTPMREGKRLGVPVPHLTTLYAIVKTLDYCNAHPEAREDQATTGLHVTGSISGRSPVTRTAESLNPVLNKIHHDHLCASRNVDTCREATSLGTKISLNETSNRTNGACST
ncbi:6-phosphogluconate dehydrogenase [Naematelia encephala]|uniref:6-phosphogluconate dehydrogenase n=1 Tax=Naematelia encephala TaxID=71784 RepID=A0A1Y2B7E3_9TREE|nr:6-phosphogluconate dehydrogenase [Naematelia encephala]